MNFFYVISLDRSNFFLRSH